MIVDTKSFRHPGKKTAPKTENQKTGHILNSMPYTSREKHMSKKRFTDEEVLDLRNNPNTYRVSENTLSFTKEFKEKFYNDYLHGKGPRNILRENGYSPEVLGKKRIDGLAASIKRQHELYGEFHDEPLRPGQALKPEEGKAPEEEIRELKAQVEYLKQEVEFLKKISSIRTTKA